MNDQKKIPVWLGVFLAFLIAGSIVVFFEGVSRSPSKAVPSSEPGDIRFTNISDSMFTVSWSTESPATGAILVSSNNGSGQTVLDERDTQGKLGSYTLHHISYRHAQPGTSYTVYIVSDGKKFSDSQNRPYTVQTGPSLPPSTASVEPAFGSVMTPEGIPAEGAIVYAILEGGQEISTLVKPSGSFILPLNNIRSPDLTGYLPVAERHTLTITAIYNGDDARAVTDTLNDSPVPTMVIGKEYDFRKQQAGPVETETASDKSIGAVAGVSAIKEDKTHTVELLLPKDGDSLTANLPLIQGTGIPGNLVTITLGIHSPTTATTTVQPDGLWRYSPTKPLAPGKHSVTITSSDANNKPRAITHSFTIFKSGTQVLGDATPSATLVPSPTVLPSPSVTVPPSPSPTGIEPVQEIPTSGWTLPTVCIGVFALVLTLSGIVLLL